MKTFISLFIFTTLMISVAFAQVGFTKRDFKDNNRSNWLGNGPRPMRSIIYYPATETGIKERLKDGGRFPAPVDIYNDARLLPGAKEYPLIILSHGSGGNARQMEWLGYYLALRGYIAVAIDHNGTDIEEKKPAGGLTISDYCMWERPKDISVVIDKMLADKQFAAHIDKERIAAGGFSLGGASAIWAAGAIFNLDSLVKYGPTPPAFLADAIKQQIEITKDDPVVAKSRLHMNDSYKDPRIKAVFALGPAIGAGFPASGLKSVTVPLQIVVGDGDQIAPMAQNGQHYAKNIPGSKITVISGEGGHYLKPAKGNEYGLELRKVAEMADVFFRETLKIK